jgi:hypothetical protein
MDFIKRLISVADGNEATRGIITNEKAPTFKNDKNSLRYIIFACLLAL